MIDRTAGMSKYRELCGLAVEWQTADQDKWMRLWYTASQLARGFGAYIDAPASYNDPNNGKPIPYVRIMRHGCREDGRHVPVWVESELSALDVEDDGYVRFSIAIAFEHGVNAYPKFRVGVFLRMKIVADTIHMELLNKKYIPYLLDANDPETYQQLFAAMVDLLETSFKMHPDDEPRRSIGFELTGKSSDPA